MTSQFLHDLKDESKMYSSQHSFISDIVQPIWRVLYDLLPQLQFAYDQLEINKQHYQHFFTKMTSNDHKKEDHRDDEGEEEKKAATSSKA